MRRIVYAAAVSWLDLLRRQAGNNIRDIRWKRLRYMLILSLGQVITNQQGRFSAQDFEVAGLHPVALTGLCFFIGAGPLFYLIRPGDVAKAARWAAAISSALFLAWLALPPGLVSMAAQSSFAMGMGYCAALAVYAFVHCLNAAERLLGAALTSLYYMLSQIFYAVFSGLKWIGRAQLALLMALTLICLWHYRKEDFQSEPTAARPVMNAAVPLMMLFFLAHMMMEIVYTYLPHSSNPMALLLGGLVGLLAVMVCLVLYFRFRLYAWWHMSSLYYIAMIAAFILYYTGGSQSGKTASYLLHGFEQIGFIVSFYLFGQVMSAYGGQAFYKRVWLALMALSAAVLVLPQALAQTAGRGYLVLAAVVGSVFFIAYVLLLPLFARDLFDSGAKATSLDHLSPANLPPSKEALREELMDNLDLTKREKEMTRLLLLGCTARQCGAQLGISEETARYHIKHIYKKLSINGRAELFALFDRF